MAKKTGSEQINVMRSLSQQAAAWAIGCNARSLRDNTAIPRAADGTYSVQDLVAHAARRAKRPTPPADDTETLLRIVDAITFPSKWADYTPQGIVDRLAELEAKHGDSVRLLLADELLRYFARLVSLDDDEELTPQQARDETARILEESLQEQAELRRQAQALDIVTQCDSCKRIRHGAEWQKGRPPAGSGVIFGTCLKCLGLE